MNTIDLFELIALRTKLLKAYADKKISKKDFEKELDRINDLILDF